MSKKQNPLRFNVGHIIHETPGYTKSISFEFPFYELGEILLQKTSKAQSLSAAPRRESSW